MAKKTKKEKKLERVFKKLKEFYKKIPDTVGCIECINKPKEEGGCGAWCCLLQSPQVLFSEFMHTWDYVLIHWNWEKISNLLESCLRNYLADSPVKGCVFWDSKTKLCMQHKTRPYNCYVYGITPDEEFRPRYERLKKEYANHLEIVVREQCNLIKIVTGEQLTMKQTNAWWEELKDIEQMIGIKKRQIHDEFGGTYLTYHDHILLKLCSDGVMGNLQLLRQHGNRLEKDQAISGVMQAFCERLKNG